MNSRFLLSVWFLVGIFFLPSNNAYAGQYATASQAAAACQQAASGDGYCTGVNSVYYHVNAEGSWVSAFSFAGGCSATQTPDPETGECLENPATNEECAEDGKAHDPYSGQCVDECPNGQLDNSCLAQPDDSCSFTSPDLVAVTGGQPVCSPESQCPGGSQGLVNGQLVCIGDEDITTCEAGTVTIVPEGGGGFVCASPSGDNPDDPLQDGDGNNVDNNGQLAANENDNTTTNTDNQGNPTGSSHNGGNAQANLNIAKTEANTKDISDNTGEMVELLRQIEANTSGGTAPCEGPDCPATTDDLLAHFEERADFSQLGTAPTFAETTTAIEVGLLASPIVSAFAQSPSFNGTAPCPVFSGNVYLIGEVRFDIHCTILEQHRQNLSYLFVAVWTIAAALVFLRA